MSPYKDLKKAAFQANMRLPELGLVLYTFGNASAADHHRGVFAIKPSGVPYSELKEDDMVVVDFDNKVIEGDLRPSSDTKTHALLYKEWPDIGGIAHTHSTYATAWAQAQRPVPIMGTTHADYLRVDVPCAPPMDDEMIEGDYEQQTGRQIIDHLKELGLHPTEISMILVANHAPFTWGKTVEEAVYHSAVLEEVARMAYLSLAINPDAPRLKVSLIKKHYERKHGKNAYYGQ